MLFINATFNFDWTNMNFNYDAQSVFSLVKNKMIELDYLSLSTENTQVSTSQKKSSPFGGKKSAYHKYKFYRFAGNELLEYRKKHLYYFDRKYG